LLSGNLGRLQDTGNRSGTNQTEQGSAGQGQTGEFHLGLGLLKGAAVLDFIPAGTALAIPDFYLIADWGAPPP
jgi:hypothetical protein